MVSRSHIGGGVEDVEDVAQPGASRGADKVDDMVDEVAGRGATEPDIHPAWAIAAAGVRAVDRLDEVGRVGIRETDRYDELSAVPRRGGAAVIVVKCCELLACHGRTSGVEVVYAGRARRR